MNILADCQWLCPSIWNGPVKLVAHCALYIAEAMFKHSETLLVQIAWIQCVTIALYFRICMRKKKNKFRDWGRKEKWGAGSSIDPDTRGIMTTFFFFFPLNECRPIDPVWWLKQRWGESMLNLQLQSERGCLERVMPGSLVQLTQTSVWFSATRKHFEQVSFETTCSFQQSRTEAQWMSC